MQNPNSRAAPAASTPASTQVLPNTHTVATPTQASRTTPVATAAATPRVRVTCARAIHRTGTLLPVPSAVQKASAIAENAQETQARPPGDQGSSGHRTSNPTAAATSRPTGGSRTAPDESMNQRASSGEASPNQNRTVKMMGRSPVSPRPK